MKYILFFTVVALGSLIQSSCSRQTGDNNIDVSNNETALIARIDSLTDLTYEIVHFYDSLQVMIDSMESVVRNQNINFRALFQLSSGQFQRVETMSDNEDDVYGYNYRVEIYLSEIYKSIYLKKIEYFSEGLQRIASNHKINIENLLTINPEATGNLEFYQWLDSARFSIRDEEQTYVLRIEESNSVVLDN